MRIMDSSFAKLSLDRIRSVGKCTNKNRDITLIGVFSGPSDLGKVGEVNIELTV